MSNFNAKDVTVRITSHTKCKCKYKPHREAFVQAVFVVNMNNGKKLSLTRHMPKNDVAAAVKYLSANL